MAIKTERFTEEQDRVTEDDAPDIPEEECV
jgi:hypothetical protein